MQILERIQIKLGLKMKGTGGAWWEERGEKGEEARVKGEGQSFRPTDNTRVGMK